MDKTNSILPTTVLLCMTSISILFPDNVMSDSYTDGIQKEYTVQAEDIHRQANNKSITLKLGSFHFDPLQQDPAETNNIRHLSSYEGQESG